MDKKELYAYIDENKGIFEELSDKIWGFAEISLKEHQSAKAYKTLLEELGFKVGRGIFGADMKLDILCDGPVTINLEF